MMLPAHMLVSNSPPPARRDCILQDGQRYCAEGPVSIHALALGGLGLFAWMAVLMFLIHHNVRGKLRDIVVYAWLLGTPALICIYLVLS